MHVFLIPDGNRRFAKSKHISKADAHIKGAEKIKEVIELCRESKDVTQLSVYVLSSDNINKRDEDEVKMLSSLCIKELSELGKLRSNVDGVDVRIITSLSGYGYKANSLYDMIQLTERRFKKHNEHLKTHKSERKLILNLLIGYSTEDEIQCALWDSVKPIKYCEAYQKFRNSLNVKDDVDLVIRTGGEHRLSNGLVVQSMYAEIFFSDTLLPAFTKTEFNKIISWHKKRNRRYGK